MNLQKIFTKAVDRPIEGVIKADDRESLSLEVEEYVFTKEISGRLSDFLGAYNNYRGANGVWISGFFGSGKSHLLKMLALLLENQEIEGRPALDYFLPKCGDDALLQGEMRRAVTVPAQSILFNIDQKADTITKSEIDALLSVFVKVFNEMQGYYGKQGYVAQFERDLAERNLLDAFKAAFEEMAGVSWERGREQIILEKQNISQAYAQISDSSPEAALGIVDKYRADYKVSIEDFANMVNAFIEKQGPNFRLNFFVDEVGQYIANNVKLMTNLQTIAESLATKCQGRAWIIVTAQEDMNTVLGEMGQQQSNDFSKIQDRFKTRMKLTSANVDEVIQKRLLQKNTTGEAYLNRLYDEERNNFGTLFDFSDGSVSYRNFRSQQYFIDCYPFIPYQFTLFQSAIENLSAHNAFEGHHSSVGERSMLGVFQQVTVAIANQPLGRLSTFDLMFEGIRTALKSQIQRSILNAEQHLDDELAVQVLKALFLVKYVKEFKATPRNIRVLMHSHFDADLPALRQKIETALNLLEQQTYILRNGEEYEFLTDEEKDIEQEIKNTEVDHGEVARTMEDIFFTEIIRDRKIRYEDTGQDFPFTKKLDERQVSREQELAIHFITPFHDNVDNISLLQANAMGRPELTVVLAADDRLMRDLTLHQKTTKYIRQNQSAAQQDTVGRILSDKGHQNRNRLTNIRTHLAGLISKARILVSGAEIEPATTDPRGRVYQGFQELIVSTYPNLKMLRNINYREGDIHTYLNSGQATLLDGDEATFSEAEQEIISFIQSNKLQGLRVTLKRLEDHFTTKPYGWYLAAIQCLVAKLYGRGKIEVRSDSNLLDGADLERALKNTHGFPNIILEPRVEYSARQIRDLKDFFNAFFDHPPRANEARELGQETDQACKNMLADLATLTVQTGQYPFMKALDEPISRIEAIAGQPYTFFLTELRQQADALLDLKEDILDPIRRFMSGPNKTIYNEARRFLQRQEPNFTAMAGNQAETLRAILADPDCYQGNQMKQAKRLVDDLTAEISTLLQEELTQALSATETLQDRLHKMEEYFALPAGKQAQLDATFDRFRVEIKQQPVIAVIRDLLNRFEQDVPKQWLAQIANWTREQAAQPQPEGEGQVIVEPRVEYISQNQIKVRFDKIFLVDEADVDQYLAELKAAMLTEIQAGNQIQIS